MKKIYIFILFIFNCINGEAFLEGTLVRLFDENKYKEIQDLKIGDEVLCVDKKGNLKKSFIEAIEKKEIDKFYILNIGRENLCFSEIIKLYCPGCKKFNSIDDDKVFKVLSRRYKRTFSFNFKNALELNRKVNVYSIMVKDYHNFFITESELLVHNFGGYTFAFLEIAYDSLFMPSTWSLGSYGIAISFIYAGVKFISSMFKNSENKLNFNFNGNGDFLFNGYKFDNNSNFSSISNDNIYNLSSDEIYKIIDRKIYKGEITNTDLIEFGIYDGYIEYKNKLNYLHEKNFDKNKNKKNKSKNNISSGGSAQPPNDPSDPRKNNNGNNNFKDYEEYEIENERLFNITKKTEVINNLKDRYAYNSSTTCYKLLPRAIPIFDKAIYIRWDYTHSDIECYNENGNHLGDLCPKTFKKYREANFKKNINIKRMN